MRGFYLTVMGLSILVLITQGGGFHLLLACPCGTGEAQTRQVRPQTVKSKDTSSEISVMGSMREACMTNHRKKHYENAGERIFLAGDNRIGQHIPSSLMMANRMALGCASCHRSTGRGGILFPDGKPSANITWPYLEAKYDGGDPDLLKKAITEGIASNEEPLSYWMPRWKMSEKDFQDLLQYLKTLK
ncbi:MAG: cytochrome c [Armatimonadetes bacterium]|nr:cytochrome c [Armatimonadota bacterium]